MGRRRPPRQISGAAKRRRRRERLVDSVEKKRSHSSIMDEKRQLKSVIVCPDRSLEDLGGENFDTRKTTSFISPEKHRRSLAHIDDDDNAPSESRRAKRNREGDRSHGVSVRAERVDRKRRRHSLDDDKASHRDRRLSSKEEVCSESKDVESSKDLRKQRRRHKEKRGESDASACEVIMDKELEKKSCIDALNDTAKESNTVEGDALVMPRAITSRARKKLLVLDLNGLLCDVVYGYPKARKLHKRVGKSAVFKRPFCDDFMNFCFEKFAIGVWSSRKMENVQGVVNYIMKDIRDKLLFLWDASRCTFTGFNTIENRKKPLVLKILKKLWDKEESDLPWEKGDYSPSNTVLIDDSPYKALCNPPHTGVFPHPYSYRDDNDNSLGPGGELRVYLEGLALADDVQCYIREHPFGRRAITSSSASWRYYEQIVNKISKSLKSPAKAQ